MISIHPNAAALRAAAFFCKLSFLILQFINDSPSF